jgi:hypothetical protein
VPSGAAESAVAAYTADLERELLSGLSTEHSFRPALKRLLEAVQPGVQATNEPRRIACGAPDFDISRGVGIAALTIGHLEAKDVNVSLGHAENTDQLRRYRDALDNLLLTDQFEWRWYRFGDLVRSVRLGNVGTDGHVTSTATAQAELAGLLEDFLAVAPSPIRSASELATRLARMTHLLRDLVLASVETTEASDLVLGLRDAFRQVLLPELTNFQFADMFAQTLAYGLFAARVEHGSGSGIGFTRRNASVEVPRTNPFLRSLFGLMAGQGLDDEPFVGVVDDIAQMLGYVDMPALLRTFGTRKRRSDPIIHFYETYLAAYDGDLREQRGVYYTPEPVVSYIVQSVDELLRRDFGTPDGLADTSNTDGQHRVLLLDPACGTGTFLYAVVDHIRERFRDMQGAGLWPSYVNDHLLPRLFGFELLMAPYAVAHLKLGLQLAAQDMPTAERSTWRYDVRDEQRLQIFLTNTLEEAIAHSDLLLGEFISDEANAAAEIKRELPIMVVFGNPPYSGHSANKGAWIKALVDDYKRGYPDLMRPAQAKWLQDDYVKFIRFGQWRIDESGAGILAFVTNHSYLDNPTFRGMREQLLKSFDTIYVLDLHGSERKREIAPDGLRDAPVFDIKQGVAISIFARSSGLINEPARVFHADLYGSNRQKKYEWLESNDVVSTQWTEVCPTGPLFLFKPRDPVLQAEYEAGWSLAEIFDRNGRPATGAVTTQDEFAISFTRDEAIAKVERLLATADSDEARGIWRLCHTDQWSYERAKDELSSPTWREQVGRICYRPFDLRWTVWNRNVLVHRRERVLKHVRGGPNLVLASARSNKSRVQDQFFCSRFMTEAKTAESTTQSAVFPLYLYPNADEGDDPLFSFTARETNLNREFVNQLTSRAGLEFDPRAERTDLERYIGTEDVFAWIYAVVHSRVYRQRYLQFLSSDYPRIPTTNSSQVLRSMIALGHELIDLHTLTQVHADPALSFPQPGANEIASGHPVFISTSGTGDDVVGDDLEITRPGVGRVYINGAGTEVGQYFDGVPEAVWDFEVGGHEVCEKWLKARRGRRLAFDDLIEFMKIVNAVRQTLDVMTQIDTVIPAWPLH